MSACVSWGLVAAFRSVSVALTSTTAGANVSLDATSTARVTLIPSRCSPPPRRSLSPPYGCWFLSWSHFHSPAPDSVSERFWGSSYASSPGSSRPPDPDPSPAPDGPAFVSDVQDLSPARDSIAAAGAPPPPPPGNDTEGHVDGREKRSFGFFAWTLSLLAWILAWSWWMLRWTLLVLLRSVRFLILKTVWTPIFLVSSLVFRYTILPGIFFQISNSYGVTPILLSYGGSYLLAATKFLVDSNSAIKTSVMATVWLCLYPLLVCGWLLARELGDLVFADVPRAVFPVFAFSWWCSTRIIQYLNQSTRRCAQVMQRQIPIRRWVQLLADLLAHVVIPFLIVEIVAVSLWLLSHYVKVPFSIRLLYHNRVALPYDRHLRLPVVALYTSTPSYHDPLRAVSLFAVHLWRTALDLPTVSMIFEAIQVTRAQLFVLCTWAVFSWDWAILPSLQLLSIRELTYLIAPPLGYIVYERMTCPIEHLQKANAKLERRIQALEARQNTSSL
ncbi:hypothetical protein C8R47DRAFT_88320 [Mycena vitilis]|nr:hypothetical protein C8R47DRAFT_88320 [Mycena vitilis]